MDEQLPQTTRSDGAPPPDGEDVRSESGRDEHPPVFPTRGRRFADSFGLVLVVLVTSLLLAAIVGDHAWGRSIVVVGFACTTWLALRAAMVQRRLLRLAVALIPLATALAVALQLSGLTTTAEIATAFIIGLLVLAAPLAITSRLARHLQVSADTFYGAVCVYLLLAMFFATLYSAISALTGHAFFVQVDSATSADYLYFSFTTMTTTGYGDFTAASGLGRLAAMFEAVLGQLYLITVVTLVVNNLAQARRRKLERD